MGKTLDRKSWGILGYEQDGMSIHGMGMDMGTGIRKREAYENQLHTTT